MYIYIYILFHCDPLILVKIFLLPLHLLLLLALLLLPVGAAVPLGILNGTGILSINWLWRWRFLGILNGTGILSSPSSPPTSPQSHDLIQTKQWLGSNSFCLDVLRVGKEQCIPGAA